jgi:hypothetical protein
MGSKYINAHNVQRAARMFQSKNPDTESAFSHAIPAKNWYIKLINVFDSFEYKANS